MKTQPFFVGFSRKRSSKTEYENAHEVPFQEGDRVPDQALLQLEEVQG
jgi:hypothetical protein